MSADILSFRPGRPPRRRRFPHRLKHARHLLPLVHGAVTAGLFLAVWTAADLLLDDRLIALGEVLAISKLSIGAAFGSWLRGQDWSV